MRPAPVVSSAGIVGYPQSQWEEVFDIAQQNSELIPVLGCDTQERQPLPVSPARQKILEQSRPPHSGNAEIVSLQSLGNTTIQ
jgi:hypothetical protein